MKKYFNLLLVFIASFLVVNTYVKADYADACDHAKVYTDTYYNETGWDVYVNVCDPVYDRTEYTACYDEGDAKDYCEGTYRSRTYKGNYHIVSTGECSEQSLCTCNIYNISCVFYTTCKSYKLTYDANNDGVYDPDEDTRNCASWNTTTKSTTLTLDYSVTGSCGDGSTKPTQDQINSACQGLMSNTLKSGTATLDSTKYQVKIPLYKCKSKKYLVENMREAKYHVVNKAGDHIPVYCVNPADDAPNDTTGANEYPIEVSSCESSNSTPDCGYANIMIEGQYRKDIKGNSKYNYAVIGAAMRLWGAHVNASGYNDTGIADEDNNTVPPADGLTMEDDNGVWLKFVPDDKTKEFVNVFKETYKFMLEKGIKDSYRPDTDSIYDVDTISGNGTSKLNTIACSQDRMGVFCNGEGGETGNYLYALSLYVNTVQGNPDMQSHLDELLKKDNPNYVPNNNPTGATVDVLVGNKVQITYSLKRDVEIDCNTLDDDTANDLGCEFTQKIIIKTAQGQVIAERDSYDYCKKNYCYVVIEYDKGNITCDLLEKVTVEINKYQTCENHTKKYVSCSSSPENPTQIMYGFDPKSSCDEHEDPKRKIEIIPDCRCKEGAKIEIPNCDVSKNEKYVKRTASDPSLNCILHKSSFTEEDNQNGKSYYDYSNIFGVNTNICKVYCSDSVTYYMAGKQDVYSGLQLKYDIESKVFPNRSQADKSSHALTSIVQVKRDCVSEIFYEDIPFNYSKDWKVAYGVDGEITNWKQLYEAVYKESSNQNNRKEVLNELIYDLYSCNFFTDSQIKNLTKVNGKNIVNKPKNSKNAYSIAMNILDNTKKYCNDKDKECVTGAITYEGGAKYINPNGSYLYTGQNGLDPALSTEESVYNGLGVKYCTKGQCFKGKNSEGKYDEDYSAATTSYDTEKIKWSDSVKVKVPTSDYAIFSYTMEADLYNSTRYQIEDYTGNVTVVNDNRYDQNLLTLDKYLYPVADSVKNRCEKSDSDRYVCDVNYNIGVPIITAYNSMTDFDKDKDGTIAFYRKFSNDDLTGHINNAANYSCVYTVADRTVGEKGFAFRNIDLNNPVPVKRNGTNWDSSGESSYAKYVGEVIQEIKNSGNDNLYANDYYLEYSYELTPESINNIRNYNKNHSYYDKVILNSCTTKKNDDNKEMKFNCKSEFLRELHDDLNSLEVIIYKKDGQSQYTKDKDRLGQGGDN